MDREELLYHEEARRQGVSLHRRGEDSWSIGAPPAIEPLQPGQHIVPSETLLSGDRVRLADGRIFKREMSTAELREALGLDDTEG
jgi:hypothetical protein